MKRRFSATIAVIAGAALLISCAMGAVGISRGFDWKKGGLPRSYPTHRVTLHKLEITYDWRDEWPQPAPPLGAWQGQHELSDARLFVARFIRNRTHWCHGQPNYALSAEEIRKLPQFVLTDYSFRLDLRRVAIISGLYLLAWMMFNRKAIMARQRIEKGQCGACGYDLRGILGSDCPECGTKRPIKVV